jgi:adenylate cyclase
VSDRTYTAGEAAELAGIEPELATRFWTALGFPRAGRDDPIFGDDDVEALRFASELIRSGSVEPEVALQMTRTIASSVARVAEAQIGVAAERARRLAGDDGAYLLDKTVIDRMPWLLGYAWRKHAEAALRRAIESGTDDVPLAVGFADLVGFTVLSQQVSERELAQIVDRFTTLAYETVVQLGGRVIKTIGDEVMYAVEQPRTAVEIGLSLAEAHHDDEELSDVRVGVSFGDVLDHDGDLFGPPVNLASRITAIARPGAVVVSTEVHEALAADDAYRWRALRTRSLKGIGRVPLWRVRRT